MLEFSNAFVDESGHNRGVLVVFVFNSEYGAFFKCNGVFDN